MPPWTLPGCWSLAGKHTPFELLPCRQGGYTFRVPGGGLVHSEINPAAEALRQARQAGVTRGSRPLVLGCGLGWQALACLELGAESVLVLEGNLRVLATLAAVPAARVLLEGPPCAAAGTRQVTPSSCAWWPPACSSEHVSQPLLALDGHSPLWADVLPGCRGLVTDILCRRRNGYAQEPTLDWNREQNARFLATSAEFRLYGGAWKDAPVVVCGAGPSLDSGPRRPAGRVWQRTASWPPTPHWPRCCVPASCRTWWWPWTA
jgi:hypothetical protein